MKAKKFLALALAAVTAITGFGFIAPIKSEAADQGSAAQETVDMYRLYNKSSGEHFYTASREERDTLSTAGWKYEGIGWVAPATSNTPVYRLYNPNTGDHHYTTDKEEKDSLSTAGWKYEGIGWYSDDSKTVPLYREYNPKAKTGTHNYTTAASEHKDLVKAGWKDEGTGWYGIDASSKSTTVLSDEQKEILEYLGSYGFLEVINTDYPDNGQKPITYTSLKKTPAENHIRDLLRYTFGDELLDTQFPGIYELPTDTPRLAPRVTSEAAYAYMDILCSGIWGIPASNYDLPRIAGNVADDKEAMYFNDYGVYFGYGYLPEEDAFQFIYSGSFAWYDTVSFDQRNDGKIVITYKWHYQEVYAGDDGSEPDATELLEGIRTVTYKPTDEDSAVGVPYRIVDYGI